MRLLLSALLALSLPHPALSAPDLSDQVLAEINRARTDPLSLAAALRAYRGLYRGRVVENPQGFGDRRTAEGVAAVDEAIAYLERLRPMAPLIRSPLLEDAAEDQVQDQATSGRVGHISADGASPADRARRHGLNSGILAESISYGEVSALAVVRAFTIDDGVSDRGHRADVFDPGLRFAGVACGPHRRFRAMCVVDFAGPLAPRS
jgi:uncharacterized protein YkwD